jgi:D-galactarolactone isomerase
MRRRELLAGAAAVLVAGRDEEPGARTAPWSFGTETPRLKAPPGTTDCHHYVYDDRYPAFSDTTSVPMMRHLTIIAR